MVDILMVFGGYQWGWECIGNLCVFKFMFIQLNLLILFIVFDKGKGYVVGVIDYGQEYNLIWVMVLLENGEIWCVFNLQVWFQLNWIMGCWMEGKGDVCQMEFDYCVFGQLCCFLGCGLMLYQFDGKCGYYWYIVLIKDCCVCVE